MDVVRIATTTGADAGLPRAQVDEFARSLRGDVLTAASPGYDAARALWNGMIDARPALIARCRSAADVVSAVRFARVHDLRVTARGAGHHIAGNATVRDGVVIDLSGMRGVHVDVARRTARVEPGVTLGELDHDTQAFALATPTGINSTTGLAGLALGGGYGWLTRRCGLTADNILSADVVTADGALLTASETEHSDLLWALRGGGGNFGIVTSFEMRLHRIGPTVLAGLIVHPITNAARVLRRYRDFMATAPDELTVWFVLRPAPPLPFLPPEVHGTPVVVLAACWSGDVARGEQVLAPLRALEGAHADVIGPMPFTAWQSAFDPLMLAGLRNYWKTHNFAAMPDELLGTLLDRQAAAPGPLCEIFVGNVGGVASRVPDDETAFMGRQAPYMMNVHARWDDPGLDDRALAWARETFRATAPWATAGAYVNFMTGDEGDRVRAAYGSNYDRLAAIKAKYDPTNFFRRNLNVVPQAAPVARDHVPGMVTRPAREIATDEVRLE